MKILDVSTWNEFFGLICQKGNLQVPLGSISHALDPFWVWGVTSCTIKIKAGGWHHEFETH